ncbi:hypothetical protein KIPE111705_23675 [Kibdelosporangium persicum]
MTPAFCLPPDCQATADFQRRSNCTAVNVSYSENSKHLWSFRLVKSCEVVLQASMTELVGRSRLAQDLPVHRSVE